MLEKGNQGSPTAYRGPLRAVIFDWAGTTIDFGSRAPVSAVLGAFEALDVPITLDQARAPMGRAKRDHIQAIFDFSDVAQRWEETHGTSPEEAVDLIYEKFLPLQKEILQNHADLIPGCLEAVQFCRDRGIKIGSSTGYTRELMEIVMPIAAKQGYEPDAMLCASDLSPGRPAPWMCLENARLLGVYPPAAIVKVDDSIVGIEAGLNAGMWTVGIAGSGNLVGLSESKYRELTDVEREEIVAPAHEKLVTCGAHLVIDSIAELPGAIQRIENELVGVKATVGASNP